MVLILWIGVYPRPFLDRMEPSVTRLVQYMEAARVGGRGPAARARSLAAAPRPASR